MLQAVRILAMVVLLLLGGLWAAAWLGRGEGESIGNSFARLAATLLGGDAAAPSAGGVQLPQGMVLGGPFRLTDHTGRTVTEADFAGRFLLVYFGFTYCPDVCPTELGIVAAAMDELGEQAARVTPVLITIDPERDTPAALADYVSRFHPAMVGLTGSPEQIAAAARAYRVFYAKVQRPDMTEYTMDHSSFIYLVGPDGRVRALFRPQTAPEAIAEAVRGQLRGA
ncbi:SCO family protein [Falsiroseomonas bella]|uniref:SCO family protein n=1 Tax=Falsiroseomonas bella TaxID=2184016 RepID=A0A317FDE6_9PROT|nr:SCO family protein [Falsiroseomonas bella]PWS36047.1 SCO family protein [Falsiroseomonas bella]